MKIFFVLQLILMIWTTDAYCKDKNHFLIDSTSIGGIKLGMKLSDLIKIFPNYNIERFSDGEGVALITVKKSNEELVVLYTGEEDHTQPIDTKSKIEDIETFNPKYLTKDSISVGMKVKEVERKLGKVKKITLSEIESREYVEFVNQPNSLGFRIKYCGKFDEGKRITTKYSEDCEIQSISISYIR